MRTQALRFREETLSGLRTGLAWAGPGRVGLEQGLEKGRGLRRPRGGEKCVSSRQGVSLCLRVCVFECVRACLCRAGKEQSKRVPKAS